MKVDGKGGISAKIIADSVSSVTGKRITTFELVYPRFIHAEFMTHRMFSRNAASSRAIPVKKVIEQVESNPAMPIHWGKNQPGMQAKEELNEDTLVVVQDEWEIAADSAVSSAFLMSCHNAHKQIINRILEPYQFIKVVCTATEFENFFWLRCHEDAQPEIKELSDCMYKAREQSVPVTLKPGEWHVPYYEGNYGNGVWKDSGYVNSRTGVLETTDFKLGGHTLKEALKISSSCCAQVSYRSLDDSLERAEKIYQQLVESAPVHASPFEHQATPIPEHVDDWYHMDGITHADRTNNPWSGNFKNWIQHRQLIEGHAKW